MSEHSVTGSNLNSESVDVTPETKMAKILVVDDTDALRYALARYLRDAGYEVLEASSGAQALAQASQMPDIVVLDVNLPDISGLEVCRRLKDDSATAHIPVLQTSATFVDPASRVRGLLGGADAYLSEPINRAELVATITALLRLKKAEQLAREQAQATEKARRELAEHNELLEKRVSQRTAELQTLNISLRELSHQLLAMQDDEHRRIARDLHDGIGQLLAAISINNGIISKDAERLGEKARQALSDNNDLVQEVVRNIRTLSHLLHPPLLEERGLPSALSWYVGEFGQRSGIQVTFKCAPDLGRLSAEMEIAIFRIVQEALGNILRHSKSPTADVHLGHIPSGEIRLLIKDEGIGISKERQHSLKTGARAGVGVRGMRERAAQLGGTLEIHSGPGGTEVSVLLPHSRKLPAASPAVA